MSSSLFAQVHLSLLRHPKLDKLADAAGIGAAQAIGHLVALWCVSLETAEDGDISDFIPTRLERKIEWEGEPGALFEALIDSGFVDRTDDGRVLLHDWSDHTGGALHRRADARKRKRNQRARDSHAEQGADDHVTVTPEVTPRSRDVTPEREREREREREEPPCSPPKGGAPTPEPSASPPEPEPDKPKPAKGRRRATPDDAAAHVRGLLELPWEGYPTALEAFRSKFPAYDGRNGRPTLTSKLLAIEDWARANVAKSMKRKTPAFPENWLARDYGTARYSYQRDASEGLVAAPTAQRDPSFERRRKEIEAAEIERSRQKAPPSAETPRWERDEDFDPSEHLERMRRRLKPTSRTTQNGPLFGPQQETTE